MVWWCKDHPTTIWADSAPMRCRQCGGPITDTATGKPRGVSIPCVTGDGSLAVLGTCEGDEPCEFLQFRDPSGRVTGEVHFPPGTFGWPTIGTPATDGPVSFTDGEG
jgi:hypothetical protein